MTKATVDNDPVTVVLAPDESVTVPEGEVWDVTVVVGNSDLTRLNVDGAVSQGFVEGDTNSQIFDAVFDGGTTIEEGVGQDNSGVLVTGYVVNS